MVTSVISIDGELICDNTPYYPCNLDPRNAHLIAAAPDLYEALEDAIKQLEEVTQEFMGETYNDPKLNAALAKARGEP